MPSYHPLFTLFLPQNFHNAFLKYLMIVQILFEIEDYNGAQQIRKARGEYS